MPVSLQLLVTVAWLGMLLCIPPTADAWLWPFGSSAAPSVSGAPRRLHPDIDEFDANRAVTFELMPAELAENNDMNSADVLRLVLDACHERVISDLRQRCSDMDEESMSRVAVQLYNCQAVREQRQTYPCTNEMRLADCTRDMDATTWNTYHIISNRARQVCFSVQSQLYRRQTEQTINKLSRSAGEQLRSLRGLRDEQQALWKNTKSAVDELQQGQVQLSEGQQLMLDKQLRLLDEQRQLGDSLDANIKMLERGQQELQRMSESISVAIGDTSRQLRAHHQDAQSRFSQVMSEIDHIHMNAGELWTKIEDARQQIALHRSEAEGYYHSTLSDLGRINSTIRFLADVFSVRMDWLGHEVTDSNTQLRTISTLVFHALYLLVVGVVVSFLRVPQLYRVTLLLSLLSNVSAQVWLGSSLSLPHLTIVVVSLMTGLLCLDVRRLKAQASHQAPSPTTATGRYGLERRVPTTRARFTAATDSTGFVDIEGDDEDESRHEKTSCIKAVLGRPEAGAARRCVALTPMGSDVCSRKISDGADPRRSHCRLHSPE
ncbi:hypothetical protein CAOG_07518 [Capsaspora owczarzaki ATCC 30864]|uniref:Protein brambleberry n=1 Tax=Capsaspora owczarzaki (strain ATCC 30864) TaxID=595528 RepID=A0A0D2VZ33_CAPO3|nr:hypothetical protein CAOG_07518 [Capsaspora owczarzaki ATCC 30864]KJE97032.1 hypothetical protein CAOG_007518 [Capsaspora owczarzaki ATCC 30864]|eukprot:XP_004343392.2 hypothetical protein CAOG_07518 [Capsaspora owczarzaki ATCC 30864]